MKRYIYKILYLVLSITILTSMMSLLVYAGAGATKYQNSLKDIATSIAGIATALIVVSAVVTAILYMSSFANAKNREMAKYSLYALIVGVFMLAMYNDIASWIYNLMGADPTKIDVAMKTKVGIKQAKYADGTIISGDGTVISSGDDKDPSTDIGGGVKVKDANNPEVKDETGKIISYGLVANTIKASDIPESITSQFSSKTLSELITEKTSIVTKLNDINIAKPEQRATMAELELKLYAVNARIATLQVEYDRWYYIGGHLDASSANTIQFLYDKGLLERLNIYQLMLAHDKLASGNIDLNGGYWAKINVKVNECLKTNGGNGVVPAPNFDTTSSAGILVLYKDASVFNPNAYFKFFTTDQLIAIKATADKQSGSPWSAIQLALKNLLAERKSTGT